MSKEQVIQLLKRIKGSYNINITDEILKEYTKVLSKYDNEDIILNYETYLLDNKFEPNLNNLIKDLPTIEQKEKVKRENIEKEQYVIKSDREYERYLRIKYIKKMCRKFSLNINDYFNNIDTMSLEGINNRYDSFMWSLVELQTKHHILTGYELIGLRSYYKNVLLKNKKGV